MIRQVESRNRLFRIDIFSLRATPVTQFEKQVVDRNEHREKIRHHADRVVFAEREIQQQKDAAADRQPPEFDRHVYALEFARGVQLHEPAAREQEYAEVTDQLPRRDGDVVEMKQDFVHGFGISIKRNGGCRGDIVRTTSNPVNVIRYSRACRNIEMTCRDLR